MAYDFNGTSNYIESTTAAVTVAPLTMACWFNADNATTNFSLISLARDSVGTDRFVLQAAGAVTTPTVDPVRLQINNGTTTSNSAVTTNSFTANTWNHAAGVFTSATSRKAFLNGLGGNTDTTNLTPSSLNRTSIGVTITSGTRQTYHDGRIAEVGIWNAALTDAEISSLAKGIKPTEIRPDNLVFYAPLIRDVADYVGGLSLTTNGATVADHTRRYG